MESDFVAPGNDGPLVIAEPIQMGVSICFDVRFAEWMHLFMEAGADLIALPAAFSPATGPKHWELLLRARALDNQLFIAGVSPAQSPYAYGHSLIATPDGQVQYALGERAETAVWDIDLSAVPSMRESIPLRTSRRTDLYNRVRN